MGVRIREGIVIYANAISLKVFYMLDLSQSPRSWNRLQKRGSVGAPSGTGAHGAMTGDFGQKCESAEAGSVQVSWSPSFATAAVVFMSQALAGIESGRRLSHYLTAICSH